MVNVFLIYTPFHAQYARSLIRHHFLSDSNILFNHFPRELSAEDAGESVTIRNIGGSSLDRLRGLWQCKRQLKKLASSGELVTVFIPHTLGILSNYAYHVLVKKFPNVTINVFYEGVIVFYSYSHDYLENLKYYFSRWIVSTALGIPYKIDKNLLDLKDVRITKVYTPFTAIPAPPEKVIKTALKQVQFEPEPGCAFILGLALVKKQEGDLHQVIRAIYERVKELNLKKIYFKDHPLDPSPLFVQIATEMRIDLILVNDTSSVEEIIHHYRPAYVFSSWSSGLLNLRNILPAQTLLYCYVTAAMITEEEMKKLIAVFVAEQIVVEYV